MTGNFLERWSKLKRETAADDKTPPEDRAAPEDAVLSAEKIEELIKSLPDISTLGHESDFSIFMNGWVPEDVRREALRRLWTVDKSVIEHVPLADYALDYNTPGAAPGYGVMTASADMIADVARMMGKAAFPETSGESGDADPAVEKNGGGLLPGAAASRDGDIGPGKKSYSAAAADEEGAESGPAAGDDIGALREVVEEPPAFVATRRRHGAAAPR